MRELQLHMNACMDLMEDLFQSGFLAVSESTLERMKQLSEISGQCGLLKLSDNMKQLYNQLSIMKHQMKRDREAEQVLMNLFFETNRYLELGIMKTNYDEVRKLEGGLQE